MASWFVLVWAGVIALGDARTGRIPTPLVWPGVAAPILVGVDHPVVVASALVTALPYLVAAVAGRCGGGDVKFAFAGGALVADPAIGPAVVLVAAVVGLAGHLRAGRSGPRPHGPALVGATVGALLLT
ncbi:prepilin peptidase [Gordonia sp. OPL2]|uniref:prepilin peptidase n=1 Tax=Gordonia sp. OPL2 TaxID=2486274 RepID=UPI001655BDAA|nr:prepilin peptidase [Gordonia sp. OPL2]RPA19656.1 prepilin peptidase [Gordonia sp. OPL2]